MKESNPKGFHDYIADLVLQPVITALKQQDAVVTAEHKNLWTDLGWDVCEGSGEIVEFGRMLIESELDQLSAAFFYAFWWASRSGMSVSQLVLETKSESIESAEEYLPPSDEMRDDVLESLEGYLLGRAEEAYKAYAAAELDTEFGEADATSSADSLDEQLGLLKSPSAYFDWREKEVECPDCDWVGWGSEAEVGEVYESGGDFHCPNCGKRLGYIGWPTTREMLLDPRSSETDQLQAAVIEARAEKFRREQLKDPTELPALRPGPIELIWDIEGEDVFSDQIVIRAGDSVIWREPAGWENYERFCELATILFDRYGNALRDLIPTRRSEDSLFGDKISSPSAVEYVREKLARGERP